jgi:DNA-binding FadR family transcriptional regulator
MNVQRKPLPQTGQSGPRALNDRRRIHGSIAHDMAVAIIGGRHKPGDVLPNEDDASRRLDVSRTAYREAIRILAAKGLVESRPKTGTRILPRSHWNMIDPDVLSWHFEVEPSPSFITQLFELRRIVEPSAAALAAERRSEADLEGLAAALATMKQETLASAAGNQADLDFHHNILAATGNEALVALSSSIGSTIRWSNVLKSRPGGQMRESYLDHLHVYEAIAAGDAAAARSAMEKLVGLSSDDIWRTQAKAKG